MRIAILGTGSVGRTLAARLVELGHDVTLGTRDARATLARTEVDALGRAPFADWAAANPDVAVRDFADAASWAEFVINATNGSASMDALARVGTEPLDGKVVLDLANPLDFSRGMPPTLLVKDTDSLGEQIQRAFPSARVVKSLNALTADLMAHPGNLPEAGTVFVSGNDTDAKHTVTALLEEFGHQDIIDLGDITTARGTEMLLPAWLRLYSALGTPAFTFKVVR